MEKSSTKVNKEGYNLAREGGLFHGEEYVCPKCGCRRYEADRMQATGGNLSRLFDVQNRRFTVVSCARCGYSELYRQKNSVGMDVLDFLIGG